MGFGKSSPSHSRALCELQFHVVLSWTVIGNKRQLLASWLYPTSFFFLFLFASLFLYLCFMHSPQNTIRLLIIQLSSHSSPPEISHLDDCVGCSQALQSFTEFFLFILGYVRLNHTKLLFWQVKKSDAGNFMWFIKEQMGSTRCGLTKSNSLLQACGRWGWGKGRGRVMHGSPLPLSGNRLFWAATGTWDLILLAVHSSSN